MKPNLDMARVLQAQMRAAFNVLQKRDGIESETTTEVRPVHRSARPMRNEMRTAHYWARNGAHRLTGPQRRRLTHKMGHRKRSAHRHRHTHQ